MPEICILFKTIYSRSLFYIATMSLRIFFCTIAIICTVSFLASKLRHALTYCRIEFLKIYGKIDAAKRGASAENSILPEISCTKADIDLTERKIAAGDSDRVNWVATSFNKVGTTIFALEDNRAPQCNARIANRGSSRSAEGTPEQNPFPQFPRYHWNSMLSGL